MGFRADFELLFIWVPHLVVEEPMRVPVPSDSSDDASVVIEVLLLTLLRIVFFGNGLLAAVLLYGWGRADCIADSPVISLRQKLTTSEPNFSVLIVWLPVPLDSIEVEGLVLLVRIRALWIILDWQNQWSNIWLRDQECGNLYRSPNYSWVGQRVPSANISGLKNVDSHFVCGLILFFKMLYNISLHNGIYLAYV